MSVKDAQFNAGINNVLQEIELNIKECNISQFGINPGVSHFNLVLYQSFVFWTGNPGRDNGHIVMIAKVFQSPVKIRLISAGLDNGRFKIVRHQDERNSSQESQATNQSVNEVFDALASNGHYKRVIRVWQASNKNRTPDNFSGFSVNIG